MGLWEEVMDFVTSSEDGIVSYKGPESIREDLVKIASKMANELRVPRTRILITPMLGVDGIGELGFQTIDDYHSALDEVIQDVQSFLKKSAEAGFVYMNLKWDDASEEEIDKAQRHFKSVAAGEDEFKQVLEIFRLTDEPHHDLVMKMGFRDFPSYFEWSMENAKTGGQYDGISNSLTVDAYLTLILGAAVNEAALSHEMAHEALGNLPVNETASQDKLLLKNLWEEGEDLDELALRASRFFITLYDDGTVEQVLFGGEATTSPVDIFKGYIETGRLSDGEETICRDLIQGFERVEEYREYARRIGTHELMTSDLGLNDFNEALAYLVGRSDVPSDDFLRVTSMNSINPEAIHKMHRKLKTMLKGASRKDILKTGKGIYTMSYETETPIMDLIDAMGES